MSIEKQLRELFPGPYERLQRAWRYIKYPLLLGLLAAAIWIIPWREVFAALAQADFTYVAAGILITLPVWYLDALQFKVMTDKLRLNFSALEILSISLVVKFYSLVLPASVVSSGIRWYRYSNSSKQPMAALAALTYSRLFNIFMSIFLGIGFLLMSSQDQVTISAWQMGAMLAGVSLAMLVMPRLSKPAAGWVSNWKTRYQGRKILEFGLRNLEKVLVAFAAYHDLTPWEYLKMILYGLSSQMLNLISYYLLAEALHIDIPLLQMGWIRSLALLAVYLPINFSPGIGAREIGLGALLLAVGIGADQAIAFSLLIILRTVVFSLLGGLIELSGVIRNRSRS